jgi:hypothetical protein
MTLHRRFKFTPANAVRERLGQYTATDSVRWFAAYQWYVRQLYAWGSQHRDKVGRLEGTPYEYLNATSSISNHEPYPIYDWKQPLQRLADLLGNVGNERGAGEFLRHCGLDSWEDLAKPFIITVPYADEFPRPSWFEMRGRHFKVSPNPCHEKATWVMSGAVQLNYAGELWQVVIEYGYLHDDSHWFKHIRQKKDEPLDVFTARADAEIEELLRPDTKIAQFRLQDERYWQEARKALRGVFYDSEYRFIGWEEEVADLLAGINGTSLPAHKIPLTAARLTTLRRWGKASQKPKQTS